MVQARVSKFRGSLRAELGGAVSDEFLDALVDSDSVHY
jgi:hypothetical protein